MCREIKKIQKSTGFCIPKHSFVKLVKEITQSIPQDHFVSISPYDIRFTRNALEVLQQGVEGEIVHLLAVAEHKRMQAQTKRKQDQMRLQSIAQNFESSSSNVV